MTKLAIGIDIGGTNTVLGLVTPTGQIVARNTLQTKSYSGVENFVADCVQKINELIEEHAHPEKIAGIGIGAPNGNFYTGNIEFAPNLPWGDIVPLQSMFQQFFDYKVVLSNDANAAAKGEMIYGHARGMKDFIMITLGTGVGSGIVINGQVVFGHDGFAGELGHATVFPGGRKCGCGRLGCLEAYLSASGICNTAIDLLKTNKNSILTNYSANQLSPKRIHQAALDGDQVAIETLEKSGQILGEALSSFVTFSSPEAIFIFGGIARAGKLLFDPTKIYFEKNLLKIYQNKIKILPSKLNGADAAILGASALIWS